MTAPAKARALMAAISLLIFAVPVVLLMRWFLAAHPYNANAYDDTSLHAKHLLQVNLFRLWPGVVAFVLAFVWKKVEAVFVWLVVTFSSTFVYEAAKVHQFMRGVPMFGPLRLLPGRDARQLRAQHSGRLTRCCRPAYSGLVAVSSKS